MPDNKKYYYLRLKENFFDDNAMKIMESMPDGYLYSNILLKMYLASLQSDGRLMLNNYIPYNAQMIASITRHQTGTVEKALTIFEQLGLIEILDNGAIRMIFPNEKRNRSTKKYRAWRKAIFERDDYTCQVCRKRGGKLEAHHIEPWAVCMKKRYDVSNGITLCKDCHKQIHKRKAG